MSAASGSPRPTVAMLLYPGFTHLDLVGPHAALGSDCDIHLVATTLDPVVSDHGLAVVPTDTLQTCPAEVDVVFVPGGMGTAQVLGDREVLRFLADRAGRARYVTSVCTGSLVLGAAGLLGGYRAATHWSTRQYLELFGAQNVDDRVVIDRNRITGGGVTAGIDFGLTLLAELFGVPHAQATQLMLEYNPAPPFDSGDPDRAPAAVLEQVLATLEPHNVELARAAHHAADLRSALVPDTEPAESVSR